MCVKIRLYEGVWMGGDGKIDVRGPYLIITLIQTNISLRIFTQIKNKRFRKYLLYYLLCSL